MSKVILDDKYKIVSLGENEEIDASEYDGWEYTETYVSSDSRLMFFERVDK